MKLSAAQKELLLNMYRHEDGCGRGGQATMEVLCNLGLAEGIFGYGWPFGQIIRLTDRGRQVARKIENTIIIHPKANLPDIGLQIEGSRMLRAYCYGCGEPLRVLEMFVDGGHWCERCDPKKPPAPRTNLTRRQAWKISLTEMDDEEDDGDWDWDWALDVVQDK